MKAKSPRWFDRSYGRLLTPFETNPFHDRIAALLVAMGWILMAVAFWLGGNSGLGFDRQPDLGGYGWLIVGLLLLVAALSALYGPTAGLSNKGVNRSFSGSACAACRTMAKPVCSGTAPMTCPSSSLPLGPAFSVLQWPTSRTLATISIRALFHG